MPANDWSLNYDYGSAANTTAWITTGTAAITTANTDGSTIIWIDPMKRYAMADMTWIEEPPFAAPAPQADPPSPLSQERRVRLR